MNHATKIVIGDWSGDGHEKTDTYYIVSNLTQKEIADAYKRGVAILGFDFSEQVASEYEDSLLNEEQIHRFKTTGFDFAAKGWDGMGDSEEEKAERAEDGGVSLYGDSFVELYLHVVKLGAPDFKYEFQNTPYLNIGGYGLFC